MTDPFAVVFVPGGAAAAIVLFAGPLLWLRQHLWKRRAPLVQRLWQKHSLCAAGSVDRMHTPDIRRHSCRLPRRAGRPVRSMNRRFVREHWL